MRRRLASTAVFQRSSFVSFTLFFVSDYSESSHARMLRSRLHRGSVPALDGIPMRSSALRFVSRLAWA
jgi:hypothetical protein